MTRLPRILRPLQPQFRAVLLRTMPHVARLTRLTSRPWGQRALPQRIVEEVSVDSNRYAVLTARAPEVIRLTPPCGVPLHHPEFLDTGRTVPRRVVVELPGGRAVGEYGAIISAGDELIGELSPYFATDASIHPIYRRLRLPPIAHAPGTVAVLATRGMANYYHFLLEVIPRVALLSACHDLSGVDRFFVDRAQRFQRELLTAAGIDGARVIEPRTHPHIRATRLLVPSLPGPHMLTPPWVVDYIRSLVPVEATAARTRLYISRGGLRNTRRVDDEPALERALAERGFTTLHLERMPVREQAQAFSAAEIIVAPHGAGLANIVFCQPGTAVVELFAAAYVNPVFWRLADVVPGLRYTYIVADGSQRDGDEEGPVAADVRVDVGTVLSALDAVHSPA